MRHSGGPVLLITVGLLGFLALLDPLRPVAFMQLLRTGQARLNAIAFLAGWALSMSLLFLLALLATDAGVSARPSSGVQTWISLLELLLGIILLVLAARRWQRRNDPIAPRIIPEAVLRRLGQLNPRSAAVMGVLIQPRTLTIAAALVVARDRSGFLSMVLGFGVFALVSTGAILGILTYFIWRPEDAKGRLADVVSRLERAGPTLFMLVCLAGGSYLLIDGLRGLVSR